MLRSAPIPTCRKPAIPAEKERRSWRSTSATDHFVQFYHTDEYLIKCLAEFVDDGMWKNEAAIVIASPAHRQALENGLRARGIDLAAAKTSGQYAAFDAEETLALFMVNGEPDRSRFNESVGKLVWRARGTRRLRAFGEMVALLWEQGNRRAAIQLEELWNELGGQCDFSLYCAYPAACNTPSADGLSLDHVCTAHSAVLAAVSGADM
ncbi:MAG: putative two-component sensor histidine kinase protein [Verrucomicrobia bacterium]|nr:putative two-component sensor histidine kinase protein [Verrucomicrobiota bacterium]